MKKSIGQIFVACLLLATTTGSAIAATTAGVAATVTIQSVSVNVTSNPTVSYGTLVLGATKGTNALDLNTTPVATNNGNVPEDFTLSGQNATGTSQTWTLASTAGSAQYFHKFCTATCTTPPTNYTALTTSNTTLASIVSVSGTQSFDLYLGTPTSGITDYTSHDVSVTVTATAH
jgi:hypothetical protein